MSNVAVANAGYPNMAASACIGAPFLNILLGLGISAIAGLSLYLSLTLTYALRMRFVCASYALRILFGLC